MLSVSRIDGCICECLLVCCLCLFEYVDLPCVIILCGVWCVVIESILLIECTLVAVYDKVCMYYHSLWI